jgi:hypothetical protein
MHVPVVGVVVTISLGLSLRGMVYFPAEGGPTFKWCQAAFMKERRVHNTMRKPGQQVRIENVECHGTGS